MTATHVGPILGTLGPDQVVRAHALGDAADGDASARSTIASTTTSNANRTGSPGP
jgi:hypothetical protein